MKDKKLFSVLLCCVILIFSVRLPSYAATSWVGDSTYGWYANDSTTLSMVRKLFASQTDSYMLGRFDKILTEYPLSGYFNAYKTSGCLWHCGTCGTRTAGCIDRFYDPETNKTILLNGWQCFGYAKYCFYRFFKTFDSKTISLSSGFSSTTLKNTINNSLIGSHFRLNGHSMVYLANDGNNLYFIDANSGYNASTGCVRGKCTTNSNHISSECKINLRRFSWSEFTNRYSASGVTIYAPLSVSNSGAISINPYTSENEIADTNAVIWAKVDKPSSYAVTRIGIRVRKNGSSYENGWSKYEAPSKNYVGETYMYPYYNMNTELGFTLTHATKYYYQFYSLIEGKEYWSDEYSFTTTGSHSFSNWATTKDATCTATGTQTRKCTGCSTTETQTISAHGHNYSSDWTIDTAATCTQNGSKSRHCTRCGNKTDITQITASGHTSYNYNWLYYPQESSSGEFCKYCGVCKGIIDVYNIPYMKIERVIFTDNTIQCRILKPNIDPRLSYFVFLMPSTEQRDEIGVYMSEDDRYNIYTIKETALLKERGSFDLELWFGAGEIPYAINILDDKRYLFENISNDINGDFANDATDLILLRNKLLGAIELVTGDTNADGQINVKDLVHLKKHIAEM